ncbi:thermonuclease family protein [Alkalihalobacillus sp. BA299]|uniref:thermonuclease family protein n=1 Tax=Alkalihalobacillus sp. BA299 TaxID=2815938 RepID=UPI001FFE1EC2|nr:thermonuclease family protein [Alkalihalobacillus sp. BA299]
MKKLLFLLMTFVLLIGCKNIEEGEHNARETEEIEEIEEQVEPEEVADSAEAITDDSSESKNDVDRFIQADVVRVVDGDTIIVKLESWQEERVRLLLVDTPETVHPDKEVQPFGPESSEFAKNIMPVRETVRLELDVSERDKYINHIII